MLILNPRLLVVLGLTMIVLGGCNAGSQNTTTKALQYPFTWPIKELTVPDGVKQIPMFDMYAEDTSIEWEVNGKVLNQGTAWEQKRWEICFKPGLPGKEVADHVDSCLKPLGFRIYREGTPPESTRMYISKDYKIQANLDFLDFKPNLLTKTPGWKCYRLTTSIWSKPRPDVTSTKPIP